MAPPDTYQGRDKSCWTEREYIRPIGVIGWRRRYGDEVDSMTADVVAIRDGETVRGHWCIEVTLRPHDWPELMFAARCRQRTVDYLKADLGRNRREWIGKPVEARLVEFISDTGEAWKYIRLTAVDPTEDPPQVNSEFQSELGWKDSEMQSLLEWAMTRAGL